MHPSFTTIKARRRACAHLCLSFPNNNKSSRFSQFQQHNKDTDPRPHAIWPTAFSPQSLTANRDSPFGNVAFFF
uniref:Uncharacterized protein n=1 Tax=Takifugu rubripes TaxID=31033 RepID=A0A674NAQ1_TAKRU